MTRVLLVLLGAGSAHAASITRTSSYDYAVGSGLLIKEVIEPQDPNQCVVTAYTLDSYGHRQSTTTRPCNGSVAVTSGAPAEGAAPAAPIAFAPRTVGNTFTADQRFVTTTTNSSVAPAQTETQTYDGRFGVPTSVIGPNGLQTTWSYDSLGRKTGEVRADGTQTRWTYVYCINSPVVVVPPGATSAVCSSVTNSIGSSGIYPSYYTQVTPLKNDGVTPNGSYSRTYFDKIGRAIRTETQGFDGSGVSQIVYTDTQYDIKGEVSKKSRPYYSGAAPSWISLTYDALGRVTSTTDPGAAAGTAVTSNSYSGLTSTVTDPLGHASTQIRNIVGQLVTTSDAKNGTVTRAYDSVGNLVQTIDALSNVTSIVYDGYGRNKLAMYEPDMGVWNYAYDASGQLIQQTNGKGQVSTLTYDALGRQIKRIETDLTSNWYYDKYADGSSCTKGIGKICEVKTDNGYGRKYIYDAMGRSSSMINTFGSTSYTSGVTYSAAEGRVDTVTYPDGMQVRNGYTSLGYAASVTDLRSNTVLWQANSVDAQGKALRYTYGNGVVTNNVYSGDGHLYSSQAGPGNAAQNLSHSYDLAGNLQTRLDNITGVTATYVYDELNRLSSETRSGGGLAAAQVIGWTYNSIGNMLTRLENGVTNTYVYPVSTYGSLRPHAVSSVTGSVDGYAAPAYGYDADGNMTSGAGKSIIWTSFDKTFSITGTSAKLTYLYNAEHDRVQENEYLNGSLQKTTIFLNPGAGAGLFYEEENGTAGLKKKHYINAGGSTVAVITYNGSVWSTQYWHKDHLGSVSVITNESGSVIERMAYEPFGKRRNANGVTDPNGTLTPVSTDRGFTAHEHLDELGLINMNGRIYDPALGRFMSADPNIQDPTALQSFNRYTYAWNSPLAGADPSGYCFLGCFWQPSAPIRITFNAIHALPGQAAVDRYVMTHQWAYTIGEVAAAYYGGPDGAAAWSSYYTYQETGSVGKSVRAFVVADAEAGAFYLVGTSLPAGDAMASAENAFGHAAVGCAFGSATGGSCESGAASAGFSAAATDFGGDWSKNIAAQMAIGGTASVLGGGKFANGARTAAFGYIFNYCMHDTMGCWFQKGTNALKIVGGSAGFVVGIATCGVTMGLGCAAAVESGNQIIEGATYFANAGAEEGFKPSKSILQNVFGDDLGSHINTGLEIGTALQNAGAPVALGGFSLFVPSMSTRIEQMGTFQLGVAAGSTTGNLLSDPYYKDQIK